jgi:hypothetical protein
MVLADPSYPPQSFVVSIPLLGARGLRRDQGIIAGLHADGTLKRLSIKYFGKDYATKAGAFDCRRSARR